MYLQYNLRPHFLKNENFIIHHPVGSRQESDDYVRKLMRSQGNGKTYSDFTLVDVSKKKIIKLYRKFTKDASPRIVKTRKSEQAGRRL